MQEVAEPGLFDLFLQMFCSFEIVFKTEELKKKIPKSTPLLREEVGFKSRLLGAFQGILLSLSPVSATTAILQRTLKPRAERDRHLVTAHVGCLRTSVWDPGLGRFYCSLVLWIELSTWT